VCEPVKPLLGAINERLSADEELSFIKLNGNSKVGPRGLHSSTLQLNLSAFCVTGGAVRSCFGGV